MDSSPDSAPEDDNLEEQWERTVSVKDGKNETPKLEHKEESSVSSFPCSILISIIFSIIIAFFVYKLRATPNAENAAEVEKFIHHLKSQYPNQDEKLWLIVTYQIEEFLSEDSTAPLTFVMVYKEADRTAKLLASEVSSSAVKLKHGDDKCGDTDAHKLKGNDPIITEGYLLETTLSNITRCKKLIIYDVDDLLPNAAADMHSLLDPDYPNVKSAVYIFTIKVANELNQSIYHIVGDILKKKWESGLKSDKLDPLLSRIVNFVAIKPEPAFE